MSTVEATIQELDAELRDELSGYASDTPFESGFGSTGVNEDVSNIVFVDNVTIVEEAKKAKFTQWLHDNVFAKVRARARAPRAPSSRPSLRAPRAARRTPRPPLTSPHPHAPPQVGAILPNGIELPMGEDGKSLGYAFISYTTPAVAARAARELEKVALSRGGTPMTALTLDELRTLVARGAPAPAAPLDVEDASDDSYWLVDDQCRDEFVLRYSNTEKDRAGEEEKHETEVVWANTRGAPALDYAGERFKAMGRTWAESFVRWSPRGTYLATVHEGIVDRDGRTARAGVKLWHGKGFREGRRLEHGAHIHQTAHERGKDGKEWVATPVNDILWSPDEVRCGRARGQTRPAPRSRSPALPNAAPPPPPQRFICTWTGYPNNRNADRAFVVWDARTGKEVRKFKQAEQADAAHKFSWSPDSRFLARVVTKIDAEKRTGGAVASEFVEIYEAPLFRLLEDRSTRAPGARELAWCPRRHNILSWWTPEVADGPTTVSFLRVLPAAAPGGASTREYAKQVNQYLVQDVQVRWAPQGDYCAIVAEMLTKAQKAKMKKATGGKMLAGGAGGKMASAGYEVKVLRFKNKQGDPPIDELEIKERVVQFAWCVGRARDASRARPAGRVLTPALPSSLPPSPPCPPHPREPHAARFAVLVGDTSRLSVQFFSLGGDRGISKTHELKDQPVSALHWSPRGEVLLLTGLGMALGGHLCFYDAKEHKVLAEAAHEAANGVAWDPSGRMVATTKTRPMGKMQHAREAVSNGYTLWTFQGAKVHAADRPKVWQFAWRPRPDALLSDEELRDVRSSLRKFVERYQDEDKARIARRMLLARLRKRKALEDFRGMLAERQQEWEDNREVREALGLAHEDAGAEVLSEDVEIFLGETVSTVA